MWRLALFVLLVAPGAAHAQRVELPVRLVDLPDGDRRFATTLMIDGTPVEVGIDTGSTGLRVLPRGLGSHARSATGPKVTYSYGAGTSFEGQSISVPVAAGTIGGAVTLMRITAVGCTADHPDCPAAHVDPAAYGIQGDGIAGQGFAAILGIRLKHDPIDNPFKQLGVRRWIIELPRTPAERGRIVLNPDDAEIDGYTRIGVDGDGTTPGCLAGPQKICGRAFFDSGAAGLRVIREAPFRPWPNGTPVTISIGAGSIEAGSIEAGSIEAGSIGAGAAEQTMAVTIGRRDEASALLYAPGRGDTRLSLGFAPYFDWYVLYDTDRHQIGVKER